MRFHKSGPVNLPALIRLLERCDTKKPLSSTCEEDISMHLSKLHIASIKMGESQTPLRHHWDQHVKEPTEKWHARSMEDSNEER